MLSDHDRAFLLGVGIEPDGEPLTEFDPGRLGIERPASAPMPDPLSAGPWNCRCATVLVRPKGAPDAGR